MEQLSKYTVDLSVAGSFSQSRIGGDELGTHELI